MEEKCYRNEYKHNISQSAKKALSARLSHVLEVDKNSCGKSYIIKSLYFDTLYDSALVEKLVGAPYREKFRIRTYNDDYQVIKLEKKVKELRKGYKLCTNLTKGETEKIILGDIQFLMDKEDGLLREFYIKSKTKKLQPKTIIVYEREAYTYKPGNARVTLDFNIRASTNPVDFFNKDRPLLEIEPNKCILEVKFDKFIPDIIRDLVQINETMSIANSKYAAGRLITL